MAEISRRRPLNVRERGKSKEYDALVNGVPEWLAPALLDWLKTWGIPTDTPSAAHRLRMMQASLRISGLVWQYEVESARNSLLRKCEKDADLFLNVLDYVLDRSWDQRARPETDPPHHDIIAGHLEKILETGGSAWMVGPDTRCLVKRVVPEAAQAARLIINSGERAGQYLAEAWRHTYGREPHPGTAYREAVRAIEAAVCPVIIPKDPKGTLGKAINALKDAPAGKFTTAFSDMVLGVTPIDMVRGLMELVWTNELDRHGTHDENVPLHVSQKQAEAALHASVTLVQWFLHGVVRLATP